MSQTFISDADKTILAHDYTPESRMVKELMEQLDEYDRLEAEAKEIEEEDKIYRKKIVK